MLYVRGDPRNYDYWESNLNCEGWSYEKCKPFFEKSEGYLGSPQHIDVSSHSTQGDLKVTHLKDEEFETKDISGRFVASCAVNGLQANKDYNSSASQAGASLSQVTTENGSRCDTSTAFLFNSGAINRPNLTVLLNTRVTRIVLQGTTTTGICVRSESAHGDDQGPEICIRARREVVLSAGAVNSPWLLMLSESVRRSTSRSTASHAPLTCPA